MVRTFAELNKLYMGVMDRSLDAATAAEDGTAMRLPQNWDGVMDRLTWKTIITGAPSAVDIDLEGSLNGTVWFVLDTSTAIAGEQRTIAAGVRFVRGVLVSFTDGTTPTATVDIMPIGRA